MKIWPEEYVDNHPHYQRAVWMLDNQIAYPIDLIKFWSIVGPWRSIRRPRASGD